MTTQPSACVMCGLLDPGLPGNKHVCGACIGSIDVQQCIDSLSEGLLRKSKEAYAKFSALSKGKQAEIAVKMIVASSTLKGE